MTAIVLAVLALFYWRTGGHMFSPGPLAEAHAGIEDCAACHKPIETNQADLCMECHTEISDQLTQSTGLHARLKTPEGCLSCHSDHRGADFDMLAASIVEFDHSLTFFSLEKHALDYSAAAIECTACHTGDGYAPPDPSACRACHEDEDPAFLQLHLVDFGPSCLDCHDGVDRLSNFNHAATLFDLTGAHTSIACAGCHQDGVFTGIPLDCAACHAEPPIHLGMFQVACEDCHSTQGWRPAALGGDTFDHLDTTGFSLVKHETGFDGERLNCRSCHVDTFESFEVSLCVDCHVAGGAAFMAQHTADFGTACLSCHDGTDSIENFDHAAFFTLDGAHSDLDCAGCHTDNRFAGTPSDCVGCHVEPELHAGIFGLSCQSCHSTAGWYPAALSEHSFPLDHGGEGEIACATCHETTFTEFTCDNCHGPAEMTKEHNEEGIFDIVGRCLECHPTGLKKDDD